MKYYVDVNAAKDGNGSINRPFRRINDAAKLALPGDEVLVAPGVYREYG
jgi:alpha-N-arabinofuranosidase